MAGASWIGHAAALSLLCFYVLVSLSLQCVDGAASTSSCPPCDIVDSILKPCNTSLDMDTWPGTLVYQPTQAQAPCGCNQNYYDQIVSCLSCQSSSSAHYSVKAQSDYELVCTSFNQPWQQIYVPGQSATASSTATTGAASSTISTLPSGGATGEKSSQSSNLSSGALAGIIVSAIALVVALSVAAYVISRRRRDRRKQMYDTQYKYNDPHHRDSYAESGLPQYTGITSVHPMSNLRVMNPDSDDEGNETGRIPGHKQEPSFEVNRTASPGWRRGSFDDD